MFESIYLFNLSIYSSDTWGNFSIFFMPRFPPLPNGDNEDLTLRVIMRIKLDHLSKAFKIVSDI